MPYERTIDFALSAYVVVRFSQSGRPIDRYSVALLVFIDGVWKTARLYDNHGGTHHMHRYTRQGQKLASQSFHLGSTTEAVPAAIAHLKAHWEEIIHSWQS
jgi:hypothetical protein